MDEGDERVPKKRKAKQKQPVKPMPMASGPGMRSYVATSRVSKGY